MEAEESESDASSSESDDESESPITNVIEVFNLGGDLQNTVEQVLAARAEH